MLKGIVQVILFAGLLSGFINLPDHPDAFSPAAFYSFPIEVLVAALALLLTPREWRRWLVGLYLLALGALLFLKLADIGTQAAFQRPFNPYLDVKMIGDAWNVLSRSIGKLAGVLSLFASVLLFIGILGLFAWSCRFPESLSSGQANAWIGTAGALCAIMLLLLQLDRGEDGPPVVEAKAFPYLIERLDLITHSISDMRDFEAELTRLDPLQTRPNLMSKVAGRDVILIFVESYGRSAVEDARYAPRISARFEQMQRELDLAGYKVASHWVTSPTVAGLSWLAHGTLLSGLWVDSQARYDRLMISERYSLNRLFRSAGWQTAAAMPAITLDWPESSYFGYDTVFAARNLGYKGKPFNWITMPDQFTLSAIQKLIRDPRPRRNVMIETALISSHAPWTPVASMVDWQAVGDGKIFNDQADSGQSPAYVWADPERIRDHYIRTIDYSLEAVSSYISRYGNDAIFIVIGDHQPASVVTGPDASREVPLHIISNDDEILQSFRQQGFQAGLVPGKNPSLRMSDLRNLLVEAFSTPDR